MKYMLSVAIALFAVSATSGIVKKYKMPVVLLQKSKEVRVMVIDTGIGSHYKLTDNVEYDKSDNYVDTRFHGTHVAGIIIYGGTMTKSPAYSDKLCKNVRIISCKYTDPLKPYDDTTRAEIECVKLATKLKMDYINFSGGGTDFSSEEYDAYREFTSQGGIAVTAAGNKGSNLDSTPFYPASYGSEFGFDKNQRLERNRDGTKRYVPLKIYVVQNINATGVLGTNSNYSDLALRADGQNVISTFPKNNKFGIMTGTSQAVPQILHTILKQRCKEFN